MARSRNIKPGFFINDKLAECAPLARLLFSGLWCIADRKGRLEDRPKRIKAALLPYDNCDVDILLQELHDHDFILRYEIDGNRYIQIINFLKHQNPHIKEAASIIPPPPTKEAATEKHYTSTVQESEQHTTIPADSLNLIPDSFNESTSEQSPDEMPEPHSTGESNGKRQIPVFDEGTEQYKLALFIRQCVLENLPGAKVPDSSPDKLKRWAYDVDLMLRIDKRSYEEIRQLMDWAHRDSFWKANILSPGKLREKWDTLVAHRKRDADRVRGAPKHLQPQANNFKQREYTQDMYEKLKKATFK